MGVKNPCRAVLFCCVLLAFGFLLAGCSSYTYEHDYNSHYNHYYRPSSSHYNSTSVSYDDRGVVSRSTSSSSTYSDGYNSYSNSTSYNYNRSYARYNTHSGGRNWDADIDYNNICQRNWNQNDSYSVYSGNEKVRYKKDPLPAQNQDSYDYEQRWRSKQGNAGNNQTQTSSNSNAAYSSINANSSAGNNTAVDNAVVKKINPRLYKTEETAVSQQYNNGSARILASKAPVGDSTENKTRREVVRERKKDSSQPSAISNQQTGASAAKKEEKKDEEKNKKSDSGSSQRTRIRNR